MGALLLALAAGAATTSPSTVGDRSQAASQAAPVKLLADLEYAPGGGANVTFTIRNVGKRTLTLRDDFHLTLTKVRPGGQEPVGVVFFVFPAPEFSVIAPGTERTFLVPIGTAEGDEPGTPVRAASHPRGGGFL